MPAKIVFKYTSRSRPDNFFRGLESIVTNLANKEDYYIQVTLDSNDLTMNNPKVISLLHSYKNLVYYFGESKSKVHAINSNLEKLVQDWDILINFSDDQVFTVWGFDDLIRTDMQTSFPDLDGFLHYHDGNQPRLATMSIIGRKHFERTNNIYPPEYISVYCDNHVQQAAILLGKYKYMGNDCKIMLHIHPLHGHGVHLMDDQYRHTESFYPQDRETYFKYMENNFGI